MPVCKHCGIEVEATTGPCPLCQKPLNAQTPEKKDSNDHLSDTSRLSSIQKTRLFWELMSILHFSALVVTLLIDLITNKKLTWSLYAITSITASYIYITLLSFTLRKLLIFLPALLINSLGFLFLIDLYHNGVNWFVNPGLPLAGFFVLMLGLLMIFAGKTKERGFNIIGAAAFAVGIYCILAETFVELAANGTPSLSWSVIVAASLLPFALILFYFHYRLKRGTSLRRFFHL